MIQADELRIKNWIDIDNGEKPKYRHQITAHDIEEIDGFGEDCFPIPLTSEILKKAGFYQLPHFTVQNNWMIAIGRDRFITVACVGTPNEAVFLSEEVPPEVKAIIILRNFDYDGKTYLHDIQNIYKDITKKDLPVNNDI